MSCFGGGLGAGCVEIPSNLLISSGCLGLSGLNLTEGEGGEEEASAERVLVLEQLLEKAWCSVGYFKGLELTQLFSTQNNLLIPALSR